MLNELKEQIQALQACEIACLNCATECLKEEDVAMLADCIRGDLNCADFCNFTARLLIREDARAARVVELCMEVCAECAEECEKHDHDHCKKCAEACRKCEQLCSEYLQKYR